MTSRPPLFQLDHVGFRAGDRAIIADLSLTLPQGGVTGLVGPNGSGKSTLIKMLARSQAPASGMLCCFGQPINSYGNRDFSRLVAYMPQFTPAAEGMTVRELVALGRFPWHGTLGRFTAADARKVEEALDQASLAAMAERLVDSLSGGERQRAWLAMMLAQDTRCLLLDEPTSALDIAHQAEILALLARLAAERDLSVVIVLHDINMAARICTEIVALGNGAVVARGPAETIMDSAVLQRVYGLPLGVMPHPGGGPGISYLP